jgi:poly(hydroxyalkanoate) depolymerase family esterase
MRSPLFMTVLASLATLIGACASGGAAGAGPGSAPAASAGAATEHEVDLGTEAGTRRYRLYVPGRMAAGGAPLLVMLHGCTQDPADFAAGTRMDALAEEHGFLVLYPEQPRSRHPQACWSWYEPAHQRRGAGEPAALARMVEAVAAEHGADRRRVYAAGVSAGGAMAAILAATYPDVFAAAASHSGIAPGAAANLGEALVAMRGERGAGREAVLAAMGERRRAVPLIVFHGSADAVVAPANGRILAEQWRDVARGLAPGAAGEWTTAGGSAGERRWTRRTLGPAGAPLVEWWEVEGLGHAWSGGDPAGSYADATGPDASREIVRFLLAHQRSP